MDIIQYDTRFWQSLSFPENIPEDNTRLRRWHLNCCFYAQEIVRTKGVHRWTFDQFKVPKGCKIKTKVLQSVGGLVDKEDVYVCNVIMSTLPWVIHIEMAYQAWYRTREL